MSKYNHDEFILIMNKIIRATRIQSRIDNCFREVGEYLKDESVPHFADAMAFSRDYYVIDLCRTLDKMYDSEDTIEWYVGEIVIPDFNSKIWFDDKVYEITDDPETIWAVIEGEYL